MQVELEIVGLQRVLGWMERLPPEVQDQVVETFEEAGEEIRDGAQALAPVGVTGKLRRSIRVRRLRGFAVRVGPTAPHRHLVIKGRQSGKMPPPERLRAWAQFRGLAGKEFILARAIARKGTRPRPFMGQALAGAEDLIRERVIETVRRVLLQVVGSET